MKNWFTVLCVVLSSFSFAQDGFEIKDGKVSYSKPYALAGISSEQVVSRAKEWLLRADTSLVKPAAVNLEDKKNGKLEVTRSTRFDPDQDRAFVLVIKWQVAAKADGYTLSMIELKGYQSLRINDRLTQQPVDYNAIIIQEQGGSGPYKPVFYNKYAPLLKEQITAQADAIHAAVQKQ